MCPDLGGVLWPDGGSMGKCLFYFGFFFSLNTYAVVPIIPEVLIEDFSPGFLEKLDCSVLGQGQKLTVNPFSLPEGMTWNVPARLTQRSTQGERRVMVQTKLFKCLPDAIALVETMLKKYESRLSAQALTSANRFLSEARDTWLKLGMLKYHQQVRDVLVRTSSPLVYTIPDDGYPWQYPEHGRLRLLEVFKILRTVGIEPLNEVTPEMNLYFTRKVALEGHPRQPGDTDFVGNSSVPFAEPLLTDTAKLAGLIAIGDLHMEIGAGLVCAYKVGEEFCANAKVEERVACILDQGLAKGCPDIRAMKVQERNAIIRAARENDLAPLIPFSQRVHPSLTYNDICITVQRAHHAHHHWVEELIVNGTTREGFRNSWFAMLAHSQIHIERTLGMEMPPLIAADVGNPTNPIETVPGRELRVPYEIRKLVYAAVPGVVHGECDPEYLH